MLYIFWVDLSGSGLSRDGRRFVRDSFGKVRDSSGSFGMVVIRLGVFFVVRDLSGLKKLERRGNRGREFCVSSSDEIWRVLSHPIDMVSPFFLAGKI